MNFKEFLAQGIVVKIQPDKITAQGLLKNATEDLANVAKTTIHKSNCSLIFKNSYDCIRSSLQAFISKAGYKSYSHEAIIQFAKEQHIISTTEAMRIDKYRILRNDIEYRAARATESEAKDIVKAAEQLIPRLTKLLQTKP